MEKEIKDLVCSLVGNMNLNHAWTPPVAGEEVSESRKNEASASKVFWNNSFSTSRRRLFVSIVSRFTRRRNERTSVATRKQRINQSCEVQGGAHACRLALDGTLAVQHGVQKNASVG